MLASILGGRSNNFKFLIYVSGFPREILELLCVTLNFVFRRSSSINGCKECSPKGVPCCRLGDHLPKYMPSQTSVICTQVLPSPDGRLLHRKVFAFRVPTEDLRALSLYTSLKKNQQRKSHSFSPAVHLATSLDSSPLEMQNLLPGRTLPGLHGNADGATVATLNGLHLEGLVTILREYWEVMETSEGEWGVLPRGS